MRSGYSFIVNCHYEYPISLLFHFRSLWKICCGELESRETQFQARFCSTSSNNNWVLEATIGGRTGGRSCGSIEVGVAYSKVDPGCMFAFVNRRWRTLGTSAVNKNLAYGGWKREVCALSHVLDVNIAC